MLTLTSIYKISKMQLSAQLHKPYENVEGQRERSDAAWVYCMMMRGVTADGGSERKRWSRQVSCTVRMPFWNPNRTSAGGHTSAGVLTGNLYTAEHRLHLVNNSMNHTTGHSKQ